MQAACNRPGPPLPRGYVRRRTTPRVMASSVRPQPRAGACFGNGVPRGPAIGQAFATGGPEVPSTAHERDRRWKSRAARPLLNPERPLTGARPTGGMRCDEALDSRWPSRSLLLRSLPWRSRSARSRAEARAARRSSSRPRRTGAGAGPSWEGRRATTDRASDRVEGRRPRAARREQARGWGRRAEARDRGPARGRDRAPARAVERGRALAPAPAPARAPVAAAAAAPSAVRARPPSVLPREGAAARRPWRARR
jgi:hypothetical protein